MRTISEIKFDLLTDIICGCGRCDDCYYENFNRAQALPVRVLVDRHGDEEDKADFAEALAKLPPEQAAEILAQEERPYKWVRPWEPGDDWTDEDNYG